MRLFVASFGYDTTKEDLRRFFAPYRPLEIRMVIDRETGRSRGFAFIDLDSTDGERALLELDGAPLRDRAVRVKRALPRDERARLRVSR
jgi:RNA recognition motif-containing protein